MGREENSFAKHDVAHVNSLVLSLTHTKTANKCKILKKLMGIIFNLYINFDSIAIFMLLILPV